VSQAVDLRHMTVTVDDVMSWEPCKEYSRERVTALFAGRETITAFDVLDMDIPAEDRLWAVLREEMVPAPVLHEFACRIAEAALSQESMAGREPDPRSWAAIDAKRKWLRGEIGDKELHAAWEAARDVVREAVQEVAWTTARDIAWNAAWKNAWDAARGTAFSVAWNSAWNAARNASWSAAWDAAREEQCAMLRGMLEEQMGGGKP